MKTTEFIEMLLNYKFLEKYKIQRIKDDRGKLTIQCIPRRRACKTCIYWDNSKELAVCNSPERRGALMGRAEKRWKNLDDVVLVLFTGPYFTCFFHKTEPRSDEEELLREAIEKP